MESNVSVITKINIQMVLLIVAMLGLAGAGLYGLGQLPGPQAAELLQDMAIIMGVWIVLVLAVAVWLRLSIRQGILRSIRAAAYVIGRVAEGDLTARVQIKAYGETQKMLDGLQAMTDDLRALVGEVARSARSVADTSAQIAQGNLDLSQRTEEQASTLEETASSMEELTSTVAQNADNARQASELAATASETARKGNEVVGEVVTTMDEILDASKKIADIISVIDGIAFQTNILALNAAVEAARAGDQGRGFAVVAAEVRSLAHRTTAAAKEIKGLIADSEQKVQAGSARVDEAGHTMVGVVLSFKKVSDLISEIAAASQEQSQGIGQINTAVAQMEQVVQQNASLVEEASAATESMKEQAGGLLRMVSRFTLGAQTAAPAAPRPASTWSVSPVPIKSKPGGAQPALTAISGSGKSRGRNGQWEEF